MQALPSLPLQSNTALWDKLQGPKYLGSSTSAIQKNCWNLEEVFRLAAYLLPEAFLTLSNHRILAAFQQDLNESAFLLESEFPGNFLPPDTGPALFPLPHHRCTVFAGHSCSGCTWSRGEEGNLPHRSKLQQEETGPFMWQGRAFSPGVVRSPEAKPVGRGPGRRCFLPTLENYTECRFACWLPGRCPAAG